VAALREARTLDPRPEAVHDDQFGTSRFFDPRDLVQVKYEMVPRVEVDGVAITHAAGLFGFSRPSHYKAAEALARDGLAGLVPAKPGPQRAHKLTDEVLAHVQALLAADPSLRAAELVEAIATRFATRVHPRSLERAMARRRRADPGPKSG
jgi:transposase